MNNLLGHHIFLSSFGDEVAEEFSSKISSFHDSYIESLLLHEVGFEDDLKKNPNFNEIFYNLLIKVLKKSDPFIIIDHISDLSLDVSCSIYYLGDYDEIEGFYMTQIVSDWNGTVDSCNQIWKINRNANLLILNEHWL